MSKVIVSLISRQTIPNILFLKEMKGDKYILVSTPQMEEALNAILSIAEIEEEKMKVMEVEAFDLNDILEKLSKEITATTNQYIVNITGGTKIMAIGVYQFFSKLHSEFYYLPIGDNSYQKIIPSFEKAQKFDFEINVLDYLKCYKINVKSSTNETFNEAMTTQYFDMFVDQRISGKEHEARGLLGKRLSHNNTKIDSIDSLQLLLERLNFKPETEGLITQREAKYLTGGWFEEYIYNKIKRTLGLTDSQIKLNINILSGQTANNEWDIMFIKNNQLHVIECKIKLVAGKPSNIIFNKLGTQTKDMGLTAECFLFTLSSYRQSDSDPIQPLVGDRAKQNKIHVIDKSIVINDFELINKITTI